MGLNSKYSARLNEIKDRMARAILVYTLIDGRTVEVGSMIEGVEIRNERSTIDAAIPMYDQPNGKVTFLPNDSDEFDYNNTFSFNVWNGDLESDSAGVLFQFMLALSGVRDAIVSSNVSTKMQKEGIVSVALSFEK